MVVQRLVNAERTLKAKAEKMACEKAEEVQRLKGELTVLQVRFGVTVLQHANGSLGIPCSLLDRSICIASRMNINVDGC